MEELISVLIPCYNTEAYLRDCLDAIIAQTYKNLEILIVNDGSTDASLQIMQEYAQKDNRIIVKTRENKGVAYSRNELISLAKGKYVIFVDSDDIIAPEMCKNLYDLIIETNSDIAMSMVNRFYLGDEIKLEPFDKNFSIYEREDLILQLISVGDFYDFPVAKLFKKEILEGIEFPLNRIYEDSATIFKFYCNCKQAVVTTDKYYSYLIGRENSITTKKYTEKNLNDNYLAINDRFEYLSNNMPKLLNEIKMGYIRNILTLLERAYLTYNKDLINSDIVVELQGKIGALYNSIEDYKNQPKILNNYKLACMYLIMNNKIEEYKDVLMLVQNGNR